jgi:hypothetical protein
MFNRETVFILGAGASWHYGYPTGEELVKKVIEKATYISRYFKYSREANNGAIPQYIRVKMEDGASNDDAWKAALAESQRLEAALTQTNPLLIDYFLGLNPKLQPIGTLLIAWVILDCEKRAHFGNINRLDDKTTEAVLKKFKDNWCRFVIHQMVINCKQSSDLLSNKVTFVTFNYDVSLELTIKRALQHIEMFEDNDVQKFFGPDRVLHIYGEIRPVTAPLSFNFGETKYAIRNR